MGKDLWRHPVPATPNNDEAAKRILFFANFKNNLVCRERNKGGEGGVYHCGPSIEADRLICSLFSLVPFRSIQIGTPTV